MRIVLTRREALDVPDGINMSIFALAQAYLRDGHEVWVLGGDGGDPSRLAALYAVERLPTVETMNLPRDVRYNGMSVGWLLKGRSRLTALEPDAIICHDGPFPFAITAPNCSIAINVASGETGRLRWLREAYKRAAYARSGRIVTASTEGRAVLARQLDVPIEQIVVIPPCVDLSAYQPAPWSERENLVLHLGTTPYENVPTALAAFALLPKDDVRMAVTGQISEELALEHAALPAAVRRRVELLGEPTSEHRRRLLRQAKVASFPRRYSTPTVSSAMVEPFACGTPVVGSTEVSVDVLTHGVNGLACPPEDHRAIAAAYESLLDETTWRSLSEGALREARRYAAPAAAAEFLALLEVG